MKGHQRVRPETLEETPPKARSAWVSNDDPTTPNFADSSTRPQGMDDSLTDTPPLAAVGAGGSTQQRRNRSPLGSDDRSLGSVVVHNDIDSDAPHPQWRRLAHDTDSQISARGGRESAVSTSARHAAMHRALTVKQPVLRFNVSTQVALPITESDFEVKRMADIMVQEVEDELDAVTAQRDSLARELNWYKAELENKRMLLHEAQQELQRRDVMDQRRVVLPPIPMTPPAGASDVPAWWPAARRDLMDEFRRELQCVANGGIG